MNDLAQISPTTFAGFWRLGFTRLVPIIPPGAPVSERSSLFKRIDTPQDPRGKAPGVRGGDGRWYGYDFVAHECDETDCARWQGMGTGIGIKTGLMHGTGLTLVLIDADTKNHEHARIVRELVEKHFGLLPTRIGQDPKAGYLLIIKGEFRYTRVEFGPLNEQNRRVDRVEILSDGRQFVAHGVHPGTRALYHWPRPIAPFDDLPSTTPEAVMAFMEELRTALPNTAPLVQEGGSAEVNQETLKGAPDLVRKAVEAIPNTSDIFPTRESYVRFGIAIKAALADHPALAFDLFDAWSDRWVDGTNKEGFAEGEWKRMKPPFRIGRRQLYQWADKHGGGRFNIGETFFSVVDEAEEARSRELHDLFGVNKTADHAEDVAARLKPTPFGFPDPATIPKREWVYGHFYRLGVASMTVAPSGIGKSSLTIVEALAMASGRPLLGTAVPRGPHRVWLWNGEDDETELSLRITAAMIEYKITPEDLADRLLVDNGFLKPIVLANSNRNVPTIDEAVASALTEHIVAAEIDVLILDPFVSIHRISENDNNGMDLVAKRLAKIAHDARCAIGIVHHSRKTNGGETTIEDGRGGSALLAAMRASRALTRMTLAEGQKLAISEYWKYFRFSGVDKTSGSPQTGPSAERAEWFTMRNVPLPNGDNAGVVLRWNGSLPDGAGYPEDGYVDAILDEIDAGEWRDDVRAGAWVGHAVASVLQLDASPEGDRRAIQGVIKRLKQANRLRTIIKRDANSEIKPFVVTNRLRQIASPTDKLSDSLQERNVFE